MIRARTQLKVVRMDRRWFPARKCRRDDHAGPLALRGLAAGPAARPPRRADDAVRGHRRSAHRSAGAVAGHRQLRHALLVSGVNEKNYHGTGLIVDARRGYVVVDRNTVPVAMGDVRITFGGAVEVPGKVEFIHPLHNLAVVSYDPKSIGATPVRAATLLARELHAGDEVWVVGAHNDARIMSQKTQVSSLEVLSLPSVADAALSRQQHRGDQPDQSAGRLRRGARG